MIKNSSKMMFFIMLILSTFIVMSSNNWMSMWMGLEINLMSFIPLMKKSKNNFNSEACMMYFLVQTVGSIILLMSILLSSLVMTSPIMINEVMISIMSISIFIKMGISPFHFWVPEIMEKMSWNNCLLIMTWQKIAPMTILSNIIFLNKWIMIPVTLSTMMGAIGGLNQTSIRKILAYSSITHSGWMIACMKLESKMWILYLLIYSVINLMITYMFNKNLMFYINQINYMSPKLIDKINIIMLMMSLGGLPPFLGFLPKWMVIQSMIENKTYIQLIIMMMFSLITLFYYLRMITSTLLMSNDYIKFNLKKNNKLSMWMLMVNLSLPMTAIFSFF